MTDAECARLAQRQAAQGAHLLLELAGDAGVDGVVTAVVRARRHLVDDQLAAADEELDAHGADEAQLFGDALGDILGIALTQPVVRAGTMETSRMPLVCWFSPVGKHNPAVLVAGQHHRHFVVERQRCSSTQGSPLKCRRRAAPRRGCSSPAPCRRSRSGRP
jgi:hypothetical protein